MSTAASPVAVPDSTEPEEVSLVQLIANPERFAGRPVAVVGYCRLEFEHQTLYLHREDFLHAIRRNSVWLSLGQEDRSTPERWHDKYVHVVGVFDPGASGHLGRSAGGLDVVSLQAWSSPENPVALQDRTPPPKPE
jgi:hypothetical protein